MRKLWLVPLTIALTLPVFLAAQNRLPRECRQEIRQLCDLTGDRQAIRQCLRKKSSQLSENCQGELMKRFAARRGKTNTALGEPAVSHSGSEYSYGDAAKQNLDFYPAKDNPKAPLVVFIHGGGWSMGDKQRGNRGKDEYYNGMGYAYASLNYRLVPETQPDGQTADIAKALAYLRENSANLGFDPDAIVLMGHSAGAHLAALVSTDTSFLENAGVPMASIKGTILLDGAGYDVPRRMEKSLPPKMINKMYEDAFTKDLETQRRLSPISHVAAPNGTDWLILYVAARADAKAQSEAFGAALKQNGSGAGVIAVPGSTHKSVNQDAGVTGSFVGDKIAVFLRKIL
ncbi:MAG: alpha/beta hydrolase [Sphingorhabdus sp.]